MNDSVETKDSIRSVTEMLQDLKPTMIREAFLVELLLVYDQIDDNLKKRLLALNTHFSALDKRLVNLKNLDAELREKLINEIDEQFRNSLGQIQADLKILTDSLLDQKNELKMIGREALKANNIVLENIAVFEKKSHNLNNVLDSFKTVSKWLPFLIIISVISIMLNSILVYKIFF